MFYWLALIFFYAEALFMLGLGRSVHLYLCRSLVNIGSTLCASLPLGTEPGQLPPQPMEAGSTSLSPFIAGFFFCFQSYLVTRQLRQEKQRMGESPNALAVLSLCWWSEQWEFIVQLSAPTLLHANADEADLSYWSTSSVNVLWSCCALVRLGSRPEGRFH